MVPADVLDFCRSLDEITLLEKLEISSEDIVDRFQDKIELFLEEFEQELVTTEELDEEEQEWYDN